MQFVVRWLRAIAAWFRRLFLHTPSIVPADDLPTDPFEQLLTQVDWETRNVMVGSVRTPEQLRFNLENRGYYAPARYIPEYRLPIRYIALHEEGLEEASGIKRYGQVLTVQKLRRGRIPVTMRPGANPREVYFYFTVREWVELPRPIEIRDSCKGKPQFTNVFLLGHCTKSYQLFSISSREDYRLMEVLHEAFQSLSDGEDVMTYSLRDDRTLSIAEGYLTVTDEAGRLLDKVSLDAFARSPRGSFNRIKKAVK